MMNLKYLVYIIMLILLYKKIWYKNLWNHLLVYNQEQQVLVVKNLGKVVLPAAGGMGSAALLLAGISAAAAGAALRRYNI